ncbi:RNA polymerase sigma factor SigJ [Nocardioides sp. ChNu-153]|uniref:RNA polymerase sigma factor SigJ n=1 Tax=Nocardioides sp. ChNu-153 TaxID=2779364 RepID=UPI00264EFA28|nr:RNA polymerase sigma factor SigJ [Nocardioides sp. ChNu-153]MDN7121086.1 RNA polymerase sigma factor SigJ [Nocardioides sp. ChNu-153]
MAADPAPRSSPAELAERYDALRPRLVGVAYAILGSRADAEDVVADTWLRLAGVAEPLDDLEAWAVVAVSRRALDVLRSARVRRETYVGPWLPEPVLGGLAAPGGPGGAGDGDDPADRVTLADEVHYALLVLLERLSPAERTAWVLHDVFGLTFDEVARVVGRTPAAVRQLASRARRHLAAERTRAPVDPAEHDAVVAAFAGASLQGDLAGLVAVLDPDVVLTGDGGGVVSSARRPVVGADRVARFLLGVLAKVDAAGRERVELVRVNGATGFAIVRPEGPDGGATTRVTGVVALTTAGGRVVRVDLVRNPAKLAGLRGLPT